MSHYWRVSIQASVLLHCMILSSLGQRIPFASSQVRWNCIWVPGCVTPVPFVGWSCRWSLIMLGILGGSMWVSHAMRKGFSIAMLGHCRCIPQFHIHRRLNIALLMVWRRLCCWLGPPCRWHVGGISSTFEYLVDTIFGSVVVHTPPLSLVSSVAGLIRIVLAGWHVLRDWSVQLTIPAYLS